eukprot:UN10332
MITPKALICLGFISILEERFVLSLKATHISRGNT